MDEKIQQRLKQATPEAQEALTAELNGLLASENEAVEKVRRKIAGNICGTHQICRNLMCGGKKNLMRPVGMDGWMTGCE